MSRKQKLNITQIREFFNKYRGVAEVEKVDYNEIHMNSFTTSELLIDRFVGRLDQKVLGFRQLFHSCKSRIHDGHRWAEAWAKKD